MKNSKENAVLQSNPVPELRAELARKIASIRSEEHTSELQSQSNLVCRLLLEKKKCHAQLHPHAGHDDPRPHRGRRSARPPPALGPRAMVRGGGPRPARLGIAPGGDRALPGR